ncbi:MAG: hypothetical protein IPN53_16680, partial [Comamonadaceae bacterium]|nr:hypothetical protein [Comamonadaceae bacterium]
MAYQITRETYGVHTAYCGFVTGAEFLESMFHNQNDPDFDIWRYAITDFLQVTGR